MVLFDKLKRTLGACLFLITLKFIHVCLRSYVREFWLNLIKHFRRRSAVSLSKTMSSGNLRWPKYSPFIIISVFSQSLILIFCPDSCQQSYWGGISLSITFRIGNRSLCFWSVPLPVHTLCVLSRCIMEVSSIPCIYSIYTALVCTESNTLL